MTRLFSLFAVALALVPFASLAEEAPASEPDTRESRELQAGRDFLRVTPAQPTAAEPGQVEVLEFFWYGCPHCYEAEEHIASWLETKPEDVVFTRVPATLNRGWVLMAQAYYTAEQLDVLDVMHPALFAAFHEDPIMLGSPEKLASYFEDKADIEEAAFAEAFNSPSVASKVQRADLLARRYIVRGVPTMIVNGKFSTDPRQARGYESMVEIVDALARQELESQAESSGT